MNDSLRPVEFYLFALHRLQISDSEDRISQQLLAKFQDNK